MLIILILEDCNDGFINQLIFFTLQLYASSTNENLQQTWGEDLMIACVRYLSNVIFKAENNTRKYFSSWS